VLGDSDLDLSKPVEGINEACPPEPAAETPQDTPPNDTPDEQWMREALLEAEAARTCGDVPVGAVIVDRQGTLIGRGRNVREAQQDPTGHAEIHALRDAASRLGHWRLEGATLYVTLEPCPMCAGALVNARIARLVYGCPDPKAGAVDTLFSIGQDPRLNHRFEVQRDTLRDECAAVLRAFFGELRARAATRRAALRTGPAEGEGA